MVSEGVVEKGARRLVSALRVMLGAMFLMALALANPVWAAKSKKPKPAAAPDTSRDASSSSAIPSDAQPAAPDAAADAPAAATQADAAGGESPSQSEGQPASITAGDPAVGPLQEALSTSAATLDRLQNIVAKVWRDNPEVVQAQRAVEATGYDITTARAGYLPYLQLQTSQARKSGDSSTTLYVVLPIWSGGSTNAQVDLAKAKQRSALAELARVRLDIGQRTLEAYFNVVQAQDQVIQWNNYVRALRELQLTIERRAQEGAAPRADVETAVSRLRQAQASLEATRANLMTNRAQLSSLLNETPGALAWPEDAFLLSDEEQLAVRDRYEKHPSHLAARAEIDQQKANTSATLASLWPSVSLQYHRQLEGVQFDPTNDATLLVAQVQTGNSLQGALGYRADKMRIVALEAKLAAADRQVKSTIEIDRTQLKALGMQLQVQYEAAQAASRLIDSFIRQFDAGRKTWLEVLNSQREANDLLIQSIQLRRNYWYANAKLALDSMSWNRLGVEIVEDAEMGAKSGQ